MKRMLKLLLAAICCGSLVGCGKDESIQSITLNGSTSMEKVVNALSEVYMEENENTTVEAQFTGSSAGIEAVMKGTTDIGNSSRALKDSEKAEGITENIIAIDGIAVIVGNDLPISNLTKEELINIYTGAIKNWSELGGDDQPIVVIGREASSGTRSAFEELLEIEELCKYGQEVDSTGGVVAKVQETKGAIGYVSLDVLNGQVKALSLEGVEANGANVKAGTYSLSRPFVMATKGAIEEQNEAVQDFFEFVYSEKGQTIIQSVGLIPTK